MAKKYHTVSSVQPLSGGREMITERRIPCTSGCTYCKSERKPSKVSNLDFSLPSGRNGSPTTLDDRLPTPYHFDFKPTPRSEKERRREKRAGDRDRDRDHQYHSDGDYAPRRTSSSRGSKAIPIPPRRSHTVHEDDRSRDRPRVVQASPSRSRRESSEGVPLGFYDLLYNHGASSSRHGDRDRYAVKDSRYADPPSRTTRASHHRRRSESPMEGHYKDDDYYRERTPLRRKPKVVQLPHDPEPEVVYGSTPLVGPFSSSSYGNSPHRPGGALSQSPPASKSVRWGDDPRASQNAKISNRPGRGGLSRSASVSAGAGTGAVVGGGRGILKKTPATTEDDAAAAPAVQDLTREQYHALYHSAAAIGADARATSPQRRVKEERGEALVDSAGMIEGLRKRMNGAGASRDRRFSFDMPPRRFSVGGGAGGYGEKASSRGRRPEVFYDDSRRDWY